MKRLTIKISEQIREKVEKIVSEFNETILKEYGCKFQSQYKGNFLYLLLDEGFANLAPTLRLKFTGDINDWEFAIFKWSSEKYTTDFDFMPGAEFIDGTIHGAMQAALKLYPPQKKSDIKMRQAMFQDLSSIFKKKV